MCPLNHHTYQLSWPQLPLIAFETSDYCLKMPNKNCPSQLVFFVQPPILVHPPVQKQSRISSFDVKWAKQSFGGMEWAVKCLTLAY